MALAYSLTLDGAMRSNETLASVSPSASQALMEIHDMLVLVEGQMTCAETAAPPEEDA